MTWKHLLQFLFCLVCLVGSFGLLYFGWLMEQHGIKPLAGAGIMVGAFGTGLSLFGLAGTAGTIVMDHSN